MQTWRWWDDMPTSCDMGQTAKVNAFTPDYESMQVPIIDAAVQYECPYSGTLHVWII